MAGVVTPPAVDAKKEHVKPEKPDEQAYKAALKKAEKEHADSMAKFVSQLLTYTPAAMRNPRQTALTHADHSLFCRMLSRLNWTLLNPNRKTPRLQSVDRNFWTN